MNAMGKIWSAGKTIMEDGSVMDFKKGDLRRRVTGCDISRRGRQQWWWSKPVVTRESLFQVEEKDKCKGSEEGACLVMFKEQEGGCGQSSVHKESGSWNQRSAEKTHGKGWSLTVHWKDSVYTMREIGSPWRTLGRADINHVNEITYILKESLYLLCWQQTIEWKNEEIKGTCKEFTANTQERVCWLRPDRKWWS